MDKQKEHNDFFSTYRLFAVAKLIYNNPYITKKRLTDEFEVAARTIERDIANLKDFYGAPIEYDRFHKGYHYTDTTFFFENSMMKESDVFAIAGILPLLERYDNTPFKDTLKNVYNSVSRMLPSNVSVPSTIMQDVKFISEPLAEIDPDVFNAVMKATNRHNSIDFYYKSIKSTEHTFHTIEPYKIYNQKGDWYVVGFCNKHNEYSTYHLARIRDVKIGDSFTPDPDYENKVHIDPNFGVWNNSNPPEKIELLFSKNVNTYILERTWHKNQECHQNEDGSVYLSFTSNQSQEILYWIMKFGSQVKVLSPLSLKEKVLNELKKAISNY